MFDAPYFIRCIIEFAFKMIILKYQSTKQVPCCIYNHLGYPDCQIPGL